MRLPASSFQRDELVAGSYAASVWRSEVVFPVFCIFLAVATSASQGGGGAPGPGQTATQPRAQAPARDAPAGEKKGTGVIKGRVVTADGGRPLRRVQITVSSPELTEARNVSTTSLGTFELKELPAGESDAAEIVEGRQ